MRIALVSVLVVAGLLLTRSGAADEPKDKRPSLAEVLDRLPGTWRTGEKAEVQVEVQFIKGKDRKVAVSQTWKKLGTSVTGAGIRYEAKEEGGVRFLECPKAFADLGKFPQKVEFRFDKGALVLKVLDGAFRGEHRLDKAADK